MRRLLMATAALGLLASPAFAHCDSMDGPVVVAVSSVAIQIPEVGG